jgi:ParB family transcriptional regulator, chromosome partitioning protein
MARKNLLSGLLGDQDAEMQPPAPVPPPLPRRTTGGAIGGVSRVMAEIRARAELEISPEIIHDDGFRDRLGIEESDFAELRDSIQSSGQRVPILVRPHTERPGEYRVVYGRRRLAAIRPLGIKVRALVQELTDEEAVLAQGQENSARRDPSFIEKAAFASSLREAGYANAVIQDALVIDKAILSRMKSVTDVVPMDLIVAIGAAPNSGRRRWEDLAQAIRDQDVTDPLEAAFPEPPPPDSTSDSRLMLAIRNIATAKTVVRGQRASSAEAELKLADGRTLGRIKSGARSIDLRLMRKPEPDFAAWIESDPDRALARLHETWSKESGST